jgi:Mg-chelatase subunit ChlD
MALARMQLAEGVQLLVSALSKNQHRTAQSVAQALTELTGASLGSSAIAWERWYKDHASNPLAGRRKSLSSTNKKKGKKGKEGKKSKSGKDASVKSGGYYGLPLPRGPVCFVIDNSQSMKAELKGDYKGGGPTRISRAKTELKRILQQLEPGTRFNIVAFAREAIAFSETMETVKGDRIGDAVKWVDDLPLKLGTALYDGIDLAFRQAGRTTGSRFFKSQVSTFYVLTDGQPMRMNPDPEGRGLIGDNKKEIVAAVTEWNLMQQSTIHVIGMGKSIPHKFLGKLAAANGGRYVRIE